MADKKFNLDFYAKVKGDVTDVKGKIDQLQKQLNQLEMPSDIASNFRRKFRSLNNQLADYSALSEQTEGSVKEAEKLDSLWKDIQVSIKKTFGELESLRVSADKVSFKATTDSIKKAKDALDKFQKEREKIQKSQEYQDVKLKYDAVSKVKKQQTEELVKKKDQQKAAEQQVNIARSKLTTERLDKYNALLQKKVELEKQSADLEKSLKADQGKIADFKAKKVLTQNGSLTQAYVTAYNAKVLEKKKYIDEGPADEVLKSELQKAKRRRRDKERGLEGKFGSREKLEKRLAQKKEKDLTKEEVRAKSTLSLIDRDNAEITRLEELLAKKKRIREEWYDIDSQYKKASKISQNFSDKASIDAEQSALDKQLREDSEIQSVIKEQKNLKKLEENYENIGNEIQIINKSLDEATQQEKEFADALGNIIKREGSEGWSEVAKEIKTVSGEDISADFDDTDRARDIIRESSKRIDANIPDTLKDIAEGFQDVERPAQRASEETREFARTAKDLDRAQREVDDLKSSFLAFFSISNAIDLFKNAVRSAFETVKELDAAMTETAVVTDFSVDDMWAQLPRYTKAANELGTTTLGAYETMTLFYQQGLNTEEAFALGTETMKMARIAGLDYADATNLMTAALRGFNMELTEASSKNVNDVYSELAAITAADTEEIARAMTKTASIAHNANMEFETTAAFLSQIIETTRESAETAGTAMKTVIARFQELTKSPAEIGEVDGEVVDANKIETALKTVGVSLRDANGQFRALDDVFLELASKWSSLDKNTQRYIATIAAGSRQQSRFLAMMSDYERTMELVDAANNSADASQRQYEKTIDSLESKLNKLKNAWDEFAMGLANNELIGLGVDLLTRFLTTLNEITTVLEGNEAGKWVSSLNKIMVSFMALKVGKATFESFFDTMASRFKEGGDESAITFWQSFKSKFKVLSKPDGEMIPELGSPLENTQSLTRIIGLVRKLGVSISKTSLGAKVFGEVALTSTKAAMIGFGGVVAGVAAAGAALWALKVAYDKMYAASAKGRFEAAKESLEQVGRSADEAAQSYNDLKTSLESLEGKEVELSKLAEGTDEWKEAVRLLNQEVYSLIQQYPGLAKFLDTSGPVLGFKDSTQGANGIETLDDFRQQQYGYVNNRNVAKTGADYGFIQAQRDLAYDEMKRNQFWWRSNSTTSGLDQGVLDELTQVIFQAAQEGKTNEELEQIRSKWLEDNYNKILLNDSKGVRSFSVDELISYGQKIFDNTQDQESAFTNAKAAVLSGADREKYDEQQLAWMSSALSSEKYKQIFLDQRNALDQEASLEASKRDFASRMNYDYREDGKFYTSTEKDAEEVVFENDDVFKDQYAALLARDASFTWLDGFVERLKGYDESTRRLVEGGDKGLTRSELNKYDVDQIASEEDRAVIASRRQQEQSLFAYGDRMFKDLGIDLEDYGWLEDITSSIYSTFAEALANNAEANGAESSNEVLSLIDQYASQIPKDQVSDFLAIFNQLDLTDVGSIEGLSDKLADAGITIGNGTSDVEAFENSIIAATKAVKIWNIELTKERLGALGQLATNVQDRDESDKVFSAKDLEALFAVSPELKKSFQKTGFDEYTYEGSLEDLNQVILQIRDQLYYDFIEANPLEKESVSGTQYGNKTTAQEILATSATTPEEIKQQEAALDNLIAKEEGLAAAYDDIEKELLDQNPALKTNTRLLKAQVLQVFQNKKHIASLTKILIDNYDEFEKGNKLIAEGKQAPIEYYSAIEEIAKKGREVFGSIVDPEFVQKNYELFEQLAQGGQIGEQAFLKIQEAAREAVRSSLEANQAVMDQIGDLDAWLESVDADFAVTGTADISDIINKLVSVGQFSAEVKKQLESLLGASINYEVETQTIMVPDAGAKNPNLSSKNEMVDFTPSGFKTITIPKRIRATAGKTDYNDPGYDPPYPSSGGGGSSNEWKNPYDELYNLTQKINAELRTREILEKRYQSLLRSHEVSATKLAENSQKELASLEKQKKLQEEMLQRRKEQLSEHLNANEDMSQYGTYDSETGTITINWEAINAVTDEEKGKEIEAYISELEKIQEEIQNAEDSLLNIEDQIYEIENRGKEEFLAFEDRVKDALVSVYQSEIDEMKTINDTITDTNSKLIDNIQKAVDQQRQDRDNKKTEEELASKQRQLLYLSQDTSGANQMTMLGLQDELEEEQQDYTDTLVDQKISELQRQNDYAAAQRERQINIAQTQLDHYVETGAIWNEVKTLMDEGLDKESGLIRGSRLEEILKNSENWSGLSSEGKLQWLNDLQTQIAQAMTYFMEKDKKESESNKENNSKPNKPDSYTPAGDKDPSKIQAPEGTNGISEDERARDEARLEEIGKEWNEAETQEEKDRLHEEAEVIRKKYGYSGGEDGSEYIPISEGNTSKPAEQNGFNEKGPKPGTEGRSDKIQAPDGTNGISKEERARDEERLSLLGSAWSEAETDAERQEIHNETEAIRRKYGYSGGPEGSGYYPIKYKTGGLADFTGPAWLDGTKSRPEMVLNAKDTENFIQLKDILSSLMSRFSGTTNNTENNGDNHYDIDIYVESIGNDYDVEKLAGKVKQMINSDARYRNNNAINLQR